MTTRFYFDLPTHAPQARAVGYACGLLAGIANPKSPLDDLPPQAPVRLGPISTNNAAEFGRLFTEGHELGRMFGQQAAYQLAAVLTSFPLNQWWPICMAFGAEQMQMGEESGDEQVKGAVEGFRKIYQQHLI